MVRSIPLWLGIALTAAPVFAGRPALAARRSSLRRVVRRVRITAYCMGPCCRCGTHGVTCTGDHSLRGAAVSRHAGFRVLPLGSRLYVPGYGAARIDDVGGKVGRGQIDVRFRTHRQAARWGTRWARVLVQLPARPPRHTHPKRLRIARSTSLRERRLRRDATLLAVAQERHRSTRRSRGRTARLSGSGRWG